MNLNVTNSIKEGPSLSKIADESIVSFTRERWLMECGARCEGGRVFYTESGRPISGFIIGEISSQMKWGY